MIFSYKKMQYKPTNRQGWKRLENALFANIPNRSRAKATIVCAKDAMVSKIRVGQQIWLMRKKPNDF